MLRRANGRDDGIAVRCHLAVLAEHVRPSRLVEHDPSPPGIERFRQNAHVVDVLRSAELYTSCRCLRRARTGEKRDP